MNLVDMYTPTLPARSFEFSYSELIQDSAADLSLMNAYFDHLKFKSKMITMMRVETFTSMNVVSVRVNCVATLFQMIAHAGILCHDYEWYSSYVTFRPKKKHVLITFYPFPGREDSPTYIVIRRYEDNADRIHC